MTANYRNFFIWSLLLFFCSLQSGFANESFAESLYTAWKNKQPTPLLSSEIKGADSDLAYQTQFRYVRQRLSNDQMIGFKAGLTSVGGQKKFHVSEPIAGVLFQSGKRLQGAELKLSDFGKLMIETELGFRLNKDISKPLANILELRNAVGSWMPVIELPDLGFADIKQLKGTDIIAANSASSAFIFGEEVVLSKQPEPNAIQVKLIFNKEIINNGQGRDALGDQWEALLWLVNKMIKEGYPLKKDYILITGALGKMIPAKEGSYSAEFSDLSTIYFKVVP